MHRIFIPLLSFLLMYCQQKQPKEEFTFKKSSPTNVAKTSQSVTLENKGVGPITSVEFAVEIDSSMVRRGSAIYQEKCTACHRIGETFIGPPPNGILSRRSPEWIMNLILNTEEMLEKDSTAKALFMEFNGQLMTNQGLTEDEARDILEYFRTLN